MPVLEAREVIAPTARTASGTSAAIPLGSRGDSVNLTVDVSAVSGTVPTLDLSIEWSHDGTAWAPSEPADTFNQVTGTATRVRRFDIKAPRYRLRWAIAGTSPSFTFGVREYVSGA